MKVEAGLVGRGQRLARRQGQGDLAEVEQRPLVDRDGDRRRAAGRQGGQDVGQRRVVGRVAGHGDGDATGVVAEAFQRGAQAPDIGAGPAGQRERADRAGLLQRHEAGRPLQGGVQRRVAGGTQRGPVGDRVRGPSGGRGDEPDQRGATAGPRRSRRTTGPRRTRRTTGQHRTRRRQDGGLRAASALGTTRQDSQGVVLVSCGSLRSRIPEPVPSCSTRVDCRPAPNHAMPGGCRQLPAASARARSQRLRPGRAYPRSFLPGPTLPAGRTRRRPGPTSGPCRPSIPCSGWSAACGRCVGAW